MGCCGSTPVVDDEDEKQNLLGGSKSSRSSVDGGNKFCHKCGKRLHAGSAFCSSCGASVPGGDGRKEEKSVEEERISAEKLKEEWKRREEEDKLNKLRREVAEEERKKKHLVNSAPVQPKTGWREKEALRLAKEKEELEKKRQQTAGAWEKEEQLRKELRDRELDERFREAGLPVKSRSAICSRDAAEKRAISILGETEETFRKRQNLERQESLQQLYGMDLELHKKAQEKLQGEEERIQQAMEWIEKVSGMQRVGEFPDCLKSGKMLCALANALRPGIIPHVNERPIPLQERENIQAYLTACDRMGLKKQDLFGISDLYEEKYLPAVLQNIYAVALMASSLRSFQGPVLNVYT